VVAIATLGTTTLEKNGYETPANCVVLNHQSLRLGHIWIVFVSEIELGKKPASDDNARWNLDFSFVGS